MLYRSRLALLVVFPLGITEAEALAAANAERPNVVLIISDDQAYGDFGFMGNDQVQTPNLDRLASASAVYPNGYVPTSVCRPSLATLLTGLYPHQHGVHFNHPPPGLRQMREMTAEEYRACRARAERLIGALPTLPRVLAGHGYACLQTGKHWEGHYRNAGFTHGMTTGMPTDPPNYGTRRQEGGEWVAHGNGDAGLDIGRNTMQPIYDFVDAHADEPFFVWYAPFLPHAPFDAPRRYVDLYSDRADVPEHLVRYYANITRFDDTVGELIRYFEKKGLARRTVFILIADNGFRPRRKKSATGGYESADKRSKWSPYENGVRTPVLVRWDGRVKPGVHERLVQAVDVVPTVLSAAGLGEAIPDLPGIDLIPSAMGASPLADRPAFGEVYPNDASSLGHPSRDLLARWVRQGDFKLIVPQPKAKDARLELFNVVEDPEEAHNMAGNPAYTDRIRARRRLLDAWWTPSEPLLECGDLSPLFKRLAQPASHESIRHNVGLRHPPVAEGKKR